MYKVRNCFNYVGSKDRILPLIQQNLDLEKKHFVDLFCGSGVVGLSVSDEYAPVLLNDACWQLIRTLKYFKGTVYKDVIKGIDEVIDKFQLSKTNKEGYDKLRDFYNIATNLPENFNPIVFYCLVTHSFNYNIHINSSGGFSVPFGRNRSCFNDSLRDKFRKFQDLLFENADNIVISCDDFVNVVMDSGKEIKNCMFYCDPPYLASDSAYGRIHYLGKWDAVKERTLYDTLDYINSEGGSFLLSNVVENNGNVNEILLNWASNKYNIIPIPADYSGCNYQRKNKGNTKEVLIRNY